MVNSVTFPAAQGGDGLTYNDGTVAPRNLANGGHRDNFVNMLSQTVIMAQSSTTEAIASAASATAAAASAASAVAAPGTNATSTSSVAIGTGSKSFTIQTGKSFVVGNFLTIAETANPAVNSMFGPITAYNSGTGALTVNVTQVVGSGTIAAWTVALSGPLLSTAPLNESKGSNIASASTVNLDTASGNLIHITGTTGITAFTLASGAERTLVFDGILTITYNATTLILPTAANITTAVNDTCIIRGDGSGNSRIVAYTRASGTALSVVAPNLVLLASLTPTAAATVDFLTTFNSTYDNYLIIGEGLLPATAAALQCRFANAGTTDAGSNYASSTTFGTMSAGGTTAGLTGNTVLNTGKGLGFTINIHNVNDTTNLKTAVGSCVYQADATPTYKFDGISIGYVAANAISGIRFLWSGAANFSATGKIRIYGYTNV